jgi:hypothetical protein
MLVASRGLDPAHPLIRAYKIPVSRDDLKKRSARFRSLLEQRDPDFRNEARGIFR